MILQPRARLYDLSDLDVMVQDVSTYLLDLWMPPLALCHQSLQL
jgi:hypothetical protein